MKCIILMLCVLGGTAVNANPYQCFNYGDRCRCNPCQTGVCYGPFYDLNCVCHTMYQPLVIKWPCGKCQRVQRCHQKQCQTSCKCH